MVNDQRSAKSGMRYGTEPARFENEVAFNDFINHVLGFKT